MRLDGVVERIKQKMASRGIHPQAIASFLRMVQQVDCEQSAYVPLDQVSTPNSALLMKTPDAGDLAKLEARGKSLLEKVAVVKLNGGASIATFPSILMSLSK